MLYLLISNWGLSNSVLNFSNLADCLLDMAEESLRIGDVLGACCQWLSRMPNPGPPLPGLEEEAELALAPLLSRKKTGFYFNLLRIKIVGNILCQSSKC